MNIKNIILIFLFCSVALSDNEDNAIYILYPGPNLVSFPLLTEDKNVEDFFNPIENNILSVIGQGEIGLFNEEQWIGGLQIIDNISGYWIIVNDVSLLEVSGSYGNGPLYFLNQGANLISYPYNSNQSIASAIPSFMYDKIYAIIGENKAALFTNDGILGSLTEFEKNKAYWFFMIDPNPFTYNNPSQFTSNTNNNYIFEDEVILDYSQSTNQSVFFIKDAFINGQEINANSQISIYCNNIKVGGRNWSGNMTDVIAMGNDGYNYTENYCEEYQNIQINIIDDEFNDDMQIIGNNEWHNNDISIISLTNVELGDLNFDDNLNIADLVILIEHVIEVNVLNNNHQLLISDSNQDNQINITDIVINIESILE